MTRPDSTTELTDSLEDYLETIYVLVRDHRVARVRDIARARGVRPASVSPAMRRLGELGLIEYERREYIRLTPAGEVAARRVAARHQILVRLFEDFLRMPSDGAQADACAMEHSLSDEGVDRLVRFFEFLGACPSAQDLIDRFHACPVVNDDVEGCEQDCPARRRRRRGEAAPPRRLSELSPGEGGTVSRIEGRGELRQRLLDMGLMPDVSVEVDRTTSRGDVVWIGLGGFRISLTREEADAVMVTVP